MSPKADIELKLLAEVKQYRTFTKKVYCSALRQKVLYRPEDKKLRAAC